MLLLRCPLLAQSGHGAMSDLCPLLGVKQTWAECLVMSANDPKRTLSSVAVERDLQKNSRPKL